MQLAIASTLIILSVACSAQNLPSKQEGGEVTSKPTGSRVRLVRRDELILNLMRTFLYVTDVPAVLDMFCGNILGQLVSSETTSSVCQLFDDFSIMIRTGFEMNGINVGIVPLGILSNASMFSLYGFCKIEADSIPPDTRDRICTLVRRLIFTFDNSLNVLTLIGHLSRLAAWFL